jgi:hypothetical protein
MCKLAARRCSPSPNTGFEVLVNGTNGDDVIKVVPHDDKGDAM